MPPQYSSVIDDTAIVRAFFDFVRRRACTPSGPMLTTEPIVTVGAGRSSPSSSGGGTFMTGFDSTYSIATAYDIAADSTVRTLRAVAADRPSAWTWRRN